MTAVCSDEIPAAVDTGDDRLTVVGVRPQLSATPPTCPVGGDDVCVGRRGSVVECRRGDSGGRVCRHDDLTYGLDTVPLTG